MNAEDKPTKAMWERLAQEINRDPAVDEGLQRLTAAIAGQADKGLSCEQSRAWLPRFVEEERSGFDVVRRYPDMKRHLDTCTTCEALYIDLTTLADLDEVGTTTPPPIAVDLSFLPSITFAAYLQEVLRDIVALAYPTMAPTLEQTATRLVAQLQSGRIPQLREASVAYGTTPSLTELSYVTYTTTDTLAALPAIENSAAVIYHTAYDHMQARGFSDAVCANFAATFTRVTRPTIDLLRQISKP